jgi:uncharacterized protein YcfJ
LRRIKRRIKRRVARDGAAEDSTALRFFTLRPECQHWRMMQSHASPKERLMKNTSKTALAARLGLPALLMAASATALAAEYGTVISSTPVTAQVAVPQQECWDEQQVVQQRSSGAGALVGAIIGGAVGNGVGAGLGRAAATGLGVVAGAAIGDQAEANSYPPVATTVRRCQNASRLENRVVGYDVVYEYNGQRYSARMPQDPGQRIALDVTVAPAGSVPPSSSLPPPVYVPSQRAPVYAPQPVVYAPAPAYYYGGYGGTYYGGPSVVVVPRIVIGGTWRHGYWRY